MTRLQGLLLRLSPGVQVGVAALAGFGMVAWPWLLNSQAFGDDLTRNTIRLALAYYALATLVMMGLDDAEWTAVGPGRIARSAWTLACLIYVIHVGVAFHYFFGWSHAAAFAHTAQRSGVGEGVYVSYAFTLVWPMDVLGWWLAPQRYARRPGWVGMALHGFMLFLVFNATVVYETGRIRWAGMVYFGVLGYVVCQKYAPLWGPYLPGFLKMFGRPRRLSCTEDFSRDGV